MSPVATSVDFTWGNRSTDVRSTDKSIERRSISNYVYPQAKSVAARGRGKNVIVAAELYMDEKVIAQSLKPLLRFPCWGLQYGRHLNLTLNFGLPSLHVRGPNRSQSSSKNVRRIFQRRQVAVRGEWRLWIWYSYWKMTSSGGPPVTTSSSRLQIERGMADLDGQKRVSIEVQAETGATRFTFDLGGELQCRRMERHSDSEIWLLYKPSGYVLSVHCNGTFSHQQKTGHGKKLHRMTRRVHVGS